MKLSDLWMSLIKEWKRNPNVGTFSWILHRVTGVILVLYLFPHFWSIASSRWGAEAFTHKMQSYETPVFKFLEMGLVLLVAVHMLNGLRITIADFFFLTKSQKALFWVAVILFLAVLIASVIAFFPKIFV